MFTQQTTNGAATFRDTMVDQCRKQQIFLLGMVAVIGELAHEADNLTQQFPIRCPAFIQRLTNTLQTVDDLEYVPMLLIEHVYRVDHDRPPVPLSAVTVCPP